MADDLISLTLQEARRLALVAQGFDRPRPAQREADIGDIENVVERVKIVQVDPINVLVRAQYMPFFSRLGPYEPYLFDKYAYEQRRLYECFAHEASFIPMEHLPMIRHRMTEWKPSRAWLEFVDTHPGIEEAVMEQIMSEGPLTISDIEEKGERYGHWNTTPAKFVLEMKHRNGELAVHGRLNGSRQYDIAGRATPPEILKIPDLDKETARAEMAMHAIDAMGVATAADIADYYRYKRTEAPDTINSLVDAGKLQTVEVEGAPRTVFAKGDLRIPDKPIKASALLSPFDPLVWFRERIEWLFNFNYRIEIYVPAKKRKFGYYVLPFLMNEEFAARVDLKADRQKNVLRVPGAFLEEGQDAEETAQALAAELGEMATWLGLDRVVIGRRGKFTSALRSAVRQIKSNPN